MCFVHWDIVNYSSLVNSPNVKDWSLRSFIPPDKFCKVTKYDVVSYQEKESCDKTVASQLHSNSDFMLFMCLCIQNEKCWLMTKRDFRTSEWEILYLCGILRLILDQGFRFSLALAKFLQACLDVGSYVTSTRPRQLQRRGNWVACVRSWHGPGTMLGTMGGMYPMWWDPLAPVPLWLLWMEWCDMTPEWWQFLGFKLSHYLESVPQIYFTFIFNTRTYQELSMQSEAQICSEEEWGRGEEVSLSHESWPARCD